MDIVAVTTFFKSLTIVVGLIYLLTVLIVFFGQNFLITIQKRFIDFDDETIKKFLYGYVALFKVFFIVFVLAPYLSLLMMS
jgi:hypothetical protein